MIDRGYVGIRAAMLMGGARTVFVGQRSGYIYVSCAALTLWLGCLNTFLDIIGGQTHSLAFDSSLKKKWSMR